MSPQCSIKEFYSGRSVLVTGGSGFMGKVLVEKLLYSLPGLRAVYLLLRPQQGSSVQERADRLRQHQIFSLRLNKDYPNACNKIIPIEGDVLSEGLGISSKDLDILLEEVSVVFHFAATVRMGCSLKEAVTLNTKGTERTLKIAKGFKKLAIFVHLSTAFCYPDYAVLEEKVHSPPADPRDVMRLCEWLDEQQLARLTPSLLHPHPNTYTYSKRLAESLVNDAYPGMPCVIARPSIVCPSYREPAVGWVDNANGPAGLLLGAGKGVIRTMLCDGSIQVQVVPVDVAINGVIALAMIEATKESKPERIPIYNCNAGHQNPTTWGEVLKAAKEFRTMYPLAWPLWYPNGDITTNYILHEIRRILFHLVPAYLIDFLLLITGQTQFMVRIQNRISQGLQLLQYFTTREWHFSCSNFDNIHKILSEEEALEFLTWDENCDSREYMKNSMDGGRIYFLKEDPTKLTRNRIYLNFLFFLDVLVKALFWCFVAALLVSWLEPLRALLAPAAPALRHLPFLGRALLARPTD